MSLHFAQHSGAMQDQHAPHAAVTAEIRRRHLTARELADVLGMSASAVGDRLSGRTRWSLADAVALADHFAVSLDDLVAA